MGEAMTTLEWQDSNASVFLQECHHVLQMVNHLDPPARPP